MQVDDPATESSSAVPPPATTTDDVVESEAEEDADGIDTDYDSTFGDRYAVVSLFPHDYDRRTIEK